MPKVKCDDINICYEVQGKGFPLVMIMGLGANMDWWDPSLIQELSKKFKTVIFDNRGTGRSDKGKAEFSVKLFADDAVRLMDNLGVKRAHVLGISLGGMIAQELVLNHSDRVEKLILCSTYCGGPQAVQPAPQVTSLLSGDRQGIPPEVLVKAAFPILFTADFMKKNPDYMKQVTAQLLKAPTPPDVFTGQLQAIQKFGTYDRLPKIKAPALVMHGKKDILVPPQNAKILADRIPGAKLAYFENSAHALFSQETDKVLSTLLQFLA